MVVQYNFCFLICFALRNTPYSVRLPHPSLAMARDTFPLRGRLQWLPRPIPNSAFLIPNFAFCTLHFAFNSAFRILYSNFLSFVQIAESKIFSKRAWQDFAKSFPQANLNIRSSNPCIIKVFPNIHRVFHSQKQVSPTKKSPISAK